MVGGDIDGIFACNTHTIWNIQEASINGARHNLAIGIRL